MKNVMKLDKATIFAVALLAFISVSCKCVPPGTTEPYLSIYYCKGADGTGARKFYLILDNRTHTFIEQQTMGHTDIGTWEIINDTLCLTPNLDISNYRERGFRYREWQMDSTSVANIPRRFVKRKDQYIEVTDYSVIWTPEDIELIPEEIRNQTKAVIIYNKL